MINHDTPNRKGGRRVVSARLKSDLPRIQIVSDEACPRCGAFWGHPDPSLDFPNRIKVDNDWKCYNPNCTCGYYRNGRVLENKPSPERLQEIRDNAKTEVEAMMLNRIWIHKSGLPKGFEQSKLWPNDQPLPEGWHP